MSFVDVRLPDEYSYDTRGGPGHKTLIHELQSGQEVRIGLWEGARRTFDVQYNIQSMDEAHTLYKFYLAREGALHSFRFKDPWDYTTAANGRDAYDHTDCYIDEGDGVRQAWRLRKTYMSGGANAVRFITKPVSGTIEVGLNSVQQMSGWSCDPTTGLLVFTAPVPNGIPISWGGEFDCHVRFAQEADEAFTAAFKNYDIADLTVPLIEVIDELEIESNLSYGGYFDHGDPINDDFAISMNQGLFHLVTNGTTNRLCWLPDEDDVPLGHIFTIYNNGTATLKLLYANSSLFHYLTAGSVVEIYLIIIDGARTWVVV